MFLTHKHFLNKSFAACILLLHCCFSNAQNLSEEKLEGYLMRVQQKLGQIHPHVINAGLVDTSDKAFEAGRYFRQEDVDLIFLYVSTYSLSSTVLPVVQRAKVPVIILNLAPVAAIDYAGFNAMTNRTQITGEWLAYCSACPVPEIANVFNRT